MIDLWKRLAGWAAVTAVGMSALEIVGAPRWVILVVGLVYVTGACRALLPELFRQIKHNNR